MKTVLDLKVFCNCVNIENKILLTPYFDNNSLPVGLSIRFDPDTVAEKLETWWSIKAALLDNDHLIVIVSEYELFVNGIIECVIASKKKQYRLHKIISGLKRVLGYLSPT